MRSRLVFASVFLATTAACGALLGIDDPSVGSEHADAAPTPEAAASVDAADDRWAPMDAQGPPPDADAPPKIVFVTTALFNGGLGKVAGADKLCNDEAADGGLAGKTFRAWVSAEGTTALARIEHPGPYQLVDGRRVVADRKKLGGGTLENAISVTARGVTATGDKLVWTGTNVDMTAGQNCADFGSGANVSFGIMGDFDQTQMAKWTQNGGRQGVPFPAGTWDCGQNGHLYCFER